MERKERERDEKVRKERKKRSQDEYNAIINQSSSINHETRAQSQGSRSSGHEGKGI